MLRRTQVAFLKVGVVLLSFCTRPVVASKKGHHRDAARSDNLWAEDVEDKVDVRGADDLDPGIEAVASSSAKRAHHHGRSKNVHRKAARERSHPVKSSRTSPSSDFATNENEPMRHHEMQVPSKSSSILPDRGAHIGRSTSSKRLHAHQQHTRAENQVSHSIEPGAGQGSQSQHRRSHSGTKLLRAERQPRHETDASTKPGEGASAGGEEEVNLNAILKEIESEVARFKQVNTRRSASSAENVQTEQPEESHSTRIQHTPPSSSPALANKPLFSTSFINKLSSSASDMQMQSSGKNGKSSTSSSSSRGAFTDSLRDVISSEIQKHLASQQEPNQVGDLETALQNLVKDAVAKSLPAGMVAGGGNYIMGGGGGGYVVPPNGANYWGMMPLQRVLDHQGTPYIPAGGVSPGGWPIDHMTSVAASQPQQVRRPIIAGAASTDSSSLQPLSSSPSAGHSSSSTVPRYLRSHLLYCGKDEPERCYKLDSSGRLELGKGARQVCPGFAEKGYHHLKYPTAAAPTGSQVLNNGGLAKNLNNSTTTSTSSDLYSGNFYPEDQEQSSSTSTFFGCNVVDGDPPDRAAFRGWVLRTALGGDGSSEMGIATGRGQGALFVDQTDTEVAQQQQTPPSTFLEIGSWNFKGAGDLAPDLPRRRQAFSEDYPSGVSHGRRSKQQRRGGRRPNSEKRLLHRDPNNLRQNGEQSRGQASPRRHPGPFPPDRKQHNYRRVQQAKNRRDSTSARTRRRNRQALHGYSPVKSGVDFFREDRKIQYPTSHARRSVPKRQRRTSAQSHRVGVPSSATAGTAHAAHGMVDNYLLDDHGNTLPAPTPELHEEDSSPSTTTLVTRASPATSTSESATSSALSFQTKQQTTAHSQHVSHVDALCSPRVSIYSRDLVFDKKYDVLLPPRGALGVFNSHLADSRMHELPFAHARYLFQFRPRRVLPEGSSGDADDHSSSFLEDSSRGSTASSSSTSFFDADSGMRDEAALLLEDEDERFAGLDDGDQGGLVQKEAEPRQAKSGSSSNSDRNMLSLSDNFGGGLILHQIRLACLNGATEYCGRYVCVDEKNEFSLKPCAAGIHSSEASWFALVPGILDFSGNYKNSQLSFASSSSNGRSSSTSSSRSSSRRSTIDARPSSSTSPGSSIRHVTGKSAMAGSPQALPGQDEYDDEFPSRTFERTSAADEYDDEFPSRTLRRRRRVDQHLSNWELEHQAQTRSAMLERTGAEDGENEAMGLETDEEDVNGKYDPGQSTDYEEEETFAETEESHAVDQGAEDYDYEELGDEDDLADPYDVFAHKDEVDHHDDEDDFYAFNVGRSFLDREVYNEDTDAVPDEDAVERYEQHLEEYEDDLPTDEDHYLYRSGHQPSTEYEYDEPADYRALLDVDSYHAKDEEEEADWDHDEVGDETRLTSEDAAFEPFPSGFIEVSAPASKQATEEEDARGTVGDDTEDVNLDQMDMEDEDAQDLDEYGDSRDDAENKNTSSSFLEGTTSRTTMTRSTRSVTSASPTTPSSFYEDPYNHAEKAYRQLYLNAKEREAVAYTDQTMMARSGRQRYPNDQSDWYSQQWNTAANHFYSGASGGRSGAAAYGSPYGYGSAPSSASYPSGGGLYSGFRFGYPSSNNAMCNPSVPSMRSACTAEDFCRAMAATRVEPATSASALQLQLKHKGAGTGSSSSFSSSSVGGLARVGGGGQQSSMIGTSTTTSGWIFYCMQHVSSSVPGGGYYQVVSQYSMAPGSNPFRPLAQSVVVPGGSSPGAISSRPYYTTVAATPSSSNQPSVNTTSADLGTSGSHVATTLTGQWGNAANGMPFNIKVHTTVKSSGDGSGSPGVAGSGAGPGFVVSTINGQTFQWKNFTGHECIAVSTGSQSPATLRSQTTYETCAAICAQNTDCKGFEFNETGSIALIQLGGSEGQSSMIPPGGGQSSMMVMKTDVDNSLLTNSNSTSRTSSRASGVASSSFSASTENAMKSTYGVNAARGTSSTTRSEKLQYAENSAADANCVLMLGEQVSVAPSQTLNSTGSSCNLKHFLPQQVRSYNAGAPPPVSTPIPSNSVGGSNSPPSGVPAFSGGSYSPSNSPATFPHPSQPAPPPAQVVVYNPPVQQQSNLNPSAYNKNAVVSTPTAQPRYEILVPQGQNFWDLLPVSNREYCRQNIPLAFLRHKNDATPYYPHKTSSTTSSGNAKSDSGGGQQHQTDVENQNQATTGAPPPSSSTSTSTSTAAAVPHPTKFTFAKKSAGPFSLLLSLSVPGETDYWHLVDSLVFFTALEHGIGRILSMANGYTPSMNGRTTGVDTIVDVTSVTDVEPVRPILIQGSGQTSHLQDQPSVSSSILKTSSGPEQGTGVVVASSTTTSTHPPSSSSSSSDVQGIHRTSSSGNEAEVSASSLLTKTTTNTLQTRQQPSQSSGGGVNFRLEVRMKVDFKVTSVPGAILKAKQDIDDHTTKEILYELVGQNIDDNKAEFGYAFAFAELPYQIAEIKSIAVSSATSSNSHTPGHADSSDDEGLLSKTTTRVLLYLLLFVVLATIVAVIWYIRKTRGRAGPGQDASQEGGGDPRNYPAGGGEAAAPGEDDNYYYEQGEEGVGGSEGFGGGDAGGEDFGFGGDMSSSGGSEGRKI
ncbi:unnamed protein product [Amoebophrya sp. A25]|nr:unnamed protein product [Amoebophrya sp. A25]|eukprot:GSA25T00021992001.1